MGLGWKEPDKENVGPLVVGGHGDNHEQASRDQYLISERAKLFLVWHSLINQHRNMKNRNRINHWSFLVYYYTIN